MRNGSLTGLVMAGLAAVGLLGGFHPATARAANLPYSLSVTPFAGGYVFEGNQHITNRAVYGISAGYNVTKHWALEATYTLTSDAKTTNTNQTGGPAGLETSINVHGLRTDILYHFFPDGQLVPYIAAGGGVLLISPRHMQTNDDFLADYGAGLKFFLTDRIALRADVRHIFDFTYHDTVRPRYVYNNFAYTAGVTFQLGGVRTVTPAVEKPMPEVKAPSPEEIKPAPTPVPAAEPTPPPVPVPVKEEPTSWQGGKTAVIEGKIMVTGMKVEQNALEITASEPIRDYKIFTLSQPSRLVIDISNAVNALGVDRIEVNKIGIATVRIGIQGRFLRFVLDAAEGKLFPYRIEETGKGLKIIMADYEQKK